MTLFSHVHMPSLDGATEWLNSEPLGPAELRGHVVVVDFWTFTCINWLRTEPYVRAWSRAYRGDGLITIGVHTPEFSMEHDIARVRKAVASMDIDYPVAVDSDYAIWNAFDNHYWPALYFVDQEGVIRDTHFGEGRYEQSERRIQELLGIDRPLVGAVGVGIEAEADWSHLRSPETYLGYARSERQSESGHLHLDEWRLDGEWSVGPESVVLQQAGGSIVYRFHARDAHLVLSPGAHDPIPFRVRLDGDAPDASHGGDVDAEGNGVLADGRLYQLIRVDGDVHDRTLEIEFLAPGAEAYVFTFG
ncbi:MAG: redoxin domain-containing protein [Actinobacteria bacterium]|nr:redoxin domain-containing protein [Actinomycetota bacterium]